MYMNSMTKPVRPTGKLQRGLQRIRYVKAYPSKQKTVVEMAPLGPSSKPQTKIIFAARNASCRVTPLKMANSIAAVTESPRNTGDINDSSILVKKGFEQF
jgi:hypothetical protein